MNVKHASELILLGSTSDVLIARLESEESVGLVNGLQSVLNDEMVDYDGIESELLSLKYASVFLKTREPEHLKSLYELMVSCAASFFIQLVFVVTLIKANDSKFIVEYSPKLTALMMPAKGLFKLLLGTINRFDLMIDSEETDMDDDNDLSLMMVSAVIQLVARNEPNEAFLISRDAARLCKSHFGGDLNVPIISVMLSLANLIKGMYTEAAGDMTLAISHSQGAVLHDSLASLACIQMRAGDRDAAMGTVHKLQEVNASHDLCRRLSKIDDIFGEH